MALGTKFSLGLAGNTYFVYLQSVARYLRLTVVFMWNSALRERLIAIFQGFFC